jgi:hypothetical protein
MLTTFENSHRLHQRREERERHVRAMETYSNGYYNPDESSMTAMVDALSGNPLEKTWESEETTQSSEPKKPRSRYTTLAISLIGAVVLSSTGFWAGLEVGDQDSIPKDIGAVVDADKHRSRHSAMFSLILDWGITPRGTLEDPNSAQARAFNWLIQEDLASENTETIRSRYALASLYFATQNASDGITWTSDQHWLSSYPVCLWHGVECLDERTTLGLVKSLNLSSNALSGILPDEIGLLELDIRSLDVSNNKLIGSIPETLSRMKNLGTSKSSTLTTCNTYPNSSMLTTCN